MSIFLVKTKIVWQEQLINQLREWQSKNVVELTPSDLELIKFCFEIVEKKQNTLSKADFIKLDSFGRTQILKKLEGLK